MIQNPKLVKSNTPPTDTSVIWSTTESGKPVFKKFRNDSWETITIFELLTGKKPEIKKKTIKDIDITKEAIADLQEVYQKIGDFLHPSKSKYETTPKKTISKE